MNGRPSLLAHARFIGALARVEALRLLVDRASIGLILIVPAVQLILFGYAVNLYPQNIPLLIARSCDASAAQITHAVIATGSFRLVAPGQNLPDTSGAIYTGRALVVIDCREDGLPTVTADGSNPAAVLPAVAALNNALLQELLITEPGVAVASPPVHWLYNPEARTAWFIAPGLVGVIVMITMLMLGSLTLVREREQGTWEGLLATPVSAWDALIGKLTPYVLVAVAQALVVIGLASLLFRVPMLGNVTALAVASAVFALAHLTLGFSLSALAGSQVQAIQAAVFFYLPSMLLSGFMFPFEGMPRWAQSLGNALPLTHFVRSARGVLLKGYAAPEVLAETWPVVLFGLGAACIALASFRRQLN